MKKLIAKLCIWTLGKLGYNNSYVKNNEVVISVDATNAIRQLQRLSVELTKLKKDLDGL